MAQQVQQRWHGQQLQVVDFEVVLVVCQSNNLCDDHIIHTNCSVWLYTVHIVNSLLGIDCSLAECEVGLQQGLDSQLDFVEEQ